MLVNRPLSDHYRLLRFSAPTIAERARAGQFVMVSPDAESGPVLPRPMAIYTRDARSGVADIVYVVGAGTTALSAVAVGEAVVVTGPLGRGFTVHDDTERILLIGRGVGVGAMTTVAQDLAGRPVRVAAVLSGRHDASIIGADVRACRADVRRVTDADGTSGVPVLRERLHRAFDGDPPQQS
ncbi:ferredoxin reductase domain-containing protein [Prauserella flavalba]|uniref:hypothetical protein n=1 Tax=Prauserella flavalba TaxID=1477506 RepID=UPI001AF00BD1|nr:hypothetical protein [Prauserella flavalba]